MIHDKRGTPENRLGLLVEGVGRRFLFGVCSRELSSSWR